MNRGRVSSQVLLYFLMLMLLMVTFGCSKSDDASAPTYSVSGTVTGVAGVTVNLTGDATATTTTATDGTYSFTGLAVGNYTVTPVKAGYTFNPLSSGGHLTANQTGVDFTATANAGLTYSISGAVSGAVLAGVTITLTGDATGETITNASGNYSFPGVLLNGNYTVTPSLAGYTFSPTGTGVIISGADATRINFTATANVATTYSISGTVGGAIAGGVTITLSGGTFGTAITKTGTDGSYSFQGLLPGDYTVTPSKTGYTFSPTSRTPTVATANITGQDFTSSVDGGVILYSIGGTVSGAIADGVTINLTGAATNSDVTASGGSYSFGGLANGAYTVTPVLAGYTFAPSSTAVTISGGNSLSNNFVATANAASKYSISGTVSGEVKSGVTITLSGAGTGTTTTNSSGNYSFSGLVAGSYTLTPSLAGYTITPTSLSPTISSANITGQNFVVGAAPTAFSQADLTGSWRMNLLKKGTDTEWDRARITINSSGVATCLSVDASFSGGNVCPNPFDLKLTMNTTTGVITESGTHAVGDGGHMTMTSNKNFVVGTGTNGTTPNFSYQLAIAQKEVSGTSYSSADVQSKSFVYHMLQVGATNKWKYGTGSTNPTGALNISYENDAIDGESAPGDVGLTISVDSRGVVTMSPDMGTYQGFLSADKKTIVGTFTEDGTQYRLMIIQVTGTEFTVGPLPAGVSFAHMLGCGTSFAGWVHFTNTVAPGGEMSFSDWADSFGGSAPVGPYTGNITTTSGTLTITGNPTYHGQISHDGKFTVGTQTPQAGVYFLNVTTK
jgi:hypothetical protein